jgi:hypothetical protein
VVWQKVGHAPQHVVDALYGCVALLPCLLIWADVLLQQQHSPPPAGMQLAAVYINSSVELQTPV